jgi:hypothetical protein
MKRGETLREYMQLPPKFKILLDSGAFELALPTFATLRGQFSNADLMEAAELIQPDLLVPLDRIVKESDDEETREAKIAETLQHVHEFVKAPEFEERILGPLQGSHEEQVAMLEQYREWGINYFGVGGVIFRPLEQVKELLSSLMEVLYPPHERLHVFGVKNIKEGGDRQELHYLRWLAKLGKQYGVKISTDTSRNITRTQKMFYLTKDGRFVHLRELEALDCDQPCCSEWDIDTLRLRLQELNVEAKKKLFIHNSYRWYEVASKLESP